MGEKAQHYNSYSSTDISQQGTLEVKLFSSISSEISSLPRKYGKLMGKP